MPEMPEVEIIRIDLEKRLRGAELGQVNIRKQGLRYPFPDHFASSLQGAVVVKIKRRAKFLLLHLDNDFVWVTHLGMTGHFTIRREEHIEDHNRAALQKHIHFECLATTDGVAKRVLYSDQRRFGYMLLVPAIELPNSEWYSELGLEPLSKRFTGDYLFERSRKRRANIKSLLTNQKIVAGIGNAYVCEALWTAKIDPRRAAQSLTHAELTVIASALKDVLQSAIKAGKATIGTGAATAGSDGYFDYQYRVYNREGAACPRSDGGVIERSSSHGRSTFLCRACQV